MDTKKLEYLTPLIEGEIEANRLQGMSVRVIHHNETVFDRHYGNDKPGDIYRIFSMTKPITAVAVMILYERGLIHLLDPVSKYIPAFANQKVVDAQCGLVPAKSQVTIQQCLNMTSGMVYPSPDHAAGRYLQEVSDEIKRRLDAGDEISTLEWCEMIAGSPLAFQPGERWFYSISADVLGGVVEAVSGMKYGEFLKKEIFEPLGMVDTGYYADLGDRVSRLATMYTRYDEEGHLKEADAESMTSFNYFVAVGKTPFEGGGSGLCSTMEDYSHFASMLLNDGFYQGKQIISRKTIDYMTTNQLTPKQRETIWFDSIYGYTYSNLLRILDDKGAGTTNGSYCEFGWDGLPGNYFMVDPEEDLIMLYFQQIKEGADQSLRRKMRQIVYGAIQ
ncbi:MAG TPA: serine hydrolase [Lachnospiraceae bacterium]|nr:serine hydrolase [Lachnospiraceae bacterium]